jgi:5'-3' exonuclease
MEQPNVTTDFVKLVNEEIDESNDVTSLFNSSSIIYGMRSFQGVREYCVPKWKDKARRLIPTWESQKVVAVDLNSIFHAAFAVQPDDASGLCVNMLRNVYKTLEPTAFSVAVDCRKGVAKKYSHPEYKHKREEKPRAYYEQLDATIDTLSAKICIEECPGVEADDCLATIAFQCALLGTKCVLVANDKDLWQSLYNGVAMYCRKTQEYRNAQWLMAHHRIKPTQVVDWLCLTGGKNDLPGVKGVGEKTASDWLEAYGDFIGAMDATKNEHMSAFFKEHYWKVKEAHTLSVTTPVRWFLGLEANK